MKSEARLSRLTKMPIKLTKMDIKLTKMDTHTDLRTCILPGYSFSVTGCIIQLIIRLTFTGARTHFPGYRGDGTGLPGHSRDQFVRGAAILEVKTFVSGYCRDTRSSMHADIIMIAMLTKM
jgi:hypothetical protein